MKRRCSYVIPLWGIAFLLVIVILSCRKDDDIKPELDVSQTELTLESAASSTDTFAILSNFLAP